MTRHVVMYSSGIGSWATARRVAKQHGTDNLVLLFADVGGDHSNPHDGEDEDNYRFLYESAAAIGGELVVLNTGETIWDVFRRRRFLGNSRQANCSEELKQKPCRRWLEANCDPADTVVYIGIDWSETHRIDKIRAAYMPWRAEFPMTEPPYMDKHQMLAACRTEGIEPPRLYATGAAHANCGGGCTRAGVGAFTRLHMTNPERFAHWERREQEMRDYLGKDVTILKSGTLAALRERLDTGQSTLDDTEERGCDACFTDYGNAS